MAVIHIMKAGTFKPMSGPPVTVDERFLSGAEESYSATMRPAPLTIGHPRDDRPVLGTVKKLLRKGANLYAVVDDIANDAANAIRRGWFPHVSASFHLPDSPYNPSPGRPYLKHVGLLGGFPPAVKDLEPIALADQASEASGLVQLCMPACDIGRALDQEVEFAAPQGYTVDPKRLRLYRTAKQLVAADPSLTFEEALSTLLMR